MAKIYNSGVTFSLAQYSPTPWDVHTLQCTPRQAVYYVEGRAKSTVNFILSTEKVNRDVYIVNAFREPTFKAGDVT